MNLQTFEDIKNLVANNNIKTIEISQVSSDSKIYYHKADDGINLYFTKSWCEENKELLNKILVYIIENYKNKRLVINSGSLISDEIIRAIANNENIEEVSFGNFFDEYTLKESHYIALKDTVKKIESSDVEDSLKYNFDEVIDYNRKKNLISFYKYDEFQKGIIHILKPVDDEHLEYLKCLGDEAELVVSPEVNVINIIDKVRSAGKNNLISYRLGDMKKQFNEELFKRNINCENVIIEIGTQKYPLKEYIEYEKILYSFIEPAQNLSPFEKYIYAYDIVKKFKKYKENKKNKMKARRVYDILNNNYMVCVAYSDLLGDLLDKLGIENIAFSVEVGLQPYKANAQLKAKYGDTWEEMEKQERARLIDEQKNYIPDSWCGHSRRLVHIVDEKYGINGLYFGDPTWDNDLENDSYNFLLMTSDEVLNSGKKFKFLGTPYELFHCSSIKEFNDKLNVILNRTNVTQYMNHKTQFQYITMELSTIIKKLDIEFYNTLYQKYEFIRNNNFKIEDIYNIPQEMIEYLYDVANYITRSINNTVDGKTILNAVKNIYDTIYVGGMSQEQMDDIQTHNSELAERNFDVNKFK